MGAIIKLVICVLAYCQAPAYILAVWTQYIETYEVIQAFMLNQPKKNVGTRTLSCTWTGNWANMVGKGGK